MCVAIYKPANVKAPSLEVIENCWDTNPHGAGFCYPSRKKEGLLEIHKGFMDYKDFENAYKDYVLPREDQPVFLHFRIATHGNVDGGNTHPFPISDNLEYQRRLDSYTDYALIHNGVLPYTPPTGSIASDTMTFAGILAQSGLHKNPSSFSHLMGPVIGSSKVAVMNPEGEVTLIGTWVERDGVMFSNTHWDYPKGKWASFTDDDDYQYGWGPIVYKDDPEYHSLVTNNICPDCGSKVVRDKRWSDYYCSECGNYYEVRHSVRPKIKLPKKESFWGNK